MTEFIIKSEYYNHFLEAKQLQGLTFEEIGGHIGRNEVGVAAIFYGQATASYADFDKIASVLGWEGVRGLGDDILISSEAPDRGRGVEMPPRDPLIYRLYEIVQTYGRAYKAVLNEKFGDGIMSAIAFSTKVEKETDEDGAEWAVITLRGKWLPFTRF